jgi:hypothetical protein
MKLNLYGHSLIYLVMCALISTTILFGTVSAQIVNVLDQADELPQGFSAAFSIPLEWRTGNPDLLRIASTAELGYRTGPSMVFFIGNGELGEKDGERFLANHFEHLRLRRSLKPPIEGELFFQLLHDEFRRLTLRALAGAALRLILHRSEQGCLVIGTGYMGEYEEISEHTDQPGSGESVYSHRWSSYLKLSRRLQRNLTFTTTTLAQPVMNDIRDFRLHVEAALQVSAGAFFVTNGFRLNYDSRAPTGVEQTQTILQSALGLKL